MRSPWLVLLAFGLAGCTDGVDTDGAAPVDGGRADRLGRASDRAAMVGPLPDPVDVAWDGALPILVCAPSGLNSCMGQSVSTGKDDSLFIDADPATWTGQLTLTWQAASSLTEDLSFGLTFFQKCGATCWQGMGVGDRVTGPSPLVLDLSSLEAPAGSRGLWISVHAEKLTPDPVHAIVTPGQDFHAEGRLAASPTPVA